MKKFTITILLITISLFGNAQKKNTDANIIGDVQCKGEHVSFINITIDGTTIGTTTDATGHFQLINLPIGELNVRVSGIGYKALSKKITTAYDQTLEVKFEIEEDVLSVEEVIVSANRNAVNRADAPVVITTISPKTLSATQSVNIAEGLAFTPGLRTETNCQNCGFTQLRMNGMDGPYTQILMNSRPVFSGLAGVYGLELIPANMVERLEVVRGGGSALFGGNAIAGTVNIITKEPARNTFNIDGRMGLIGVGNGTIAAPDAQLNLTSSVISDDRKTGGYIYSMLRNRDAFDANGDGFSEMVQMKNTTFGFNVFHKPGDRAKIALDGYRISEFRRGGNKLDFLPHEADVAEQLEHLITGGNLSYDLILNKRYDKLSAYVSGQHVGRESYYGAQQDPNAYGDTRNLTTSAGANYTLNSNWFLFGASSTVFGIDNTNDYLHDVKLGANGDANTTLTKQSVNTLGTFVQHDWNTEKWRLSLGGRYDYYQITDHEADNQDISNGVLVPRASIMFKFNPDLRFRLGYAQGYRAPQVFNEDLHIELVNATRVETFNADDLKQETSNSITASINSVFRIGSSFNDFLVESFYTRLNNPFANEYYPLDDQGNYAYMRVNAKDGAYVTGLNIEWRSLLTSQIETQLGFTLQNSRFETAQAWGDEPTSVSEEFMRTPNRYGYTTVIWKPNHHLNVTLALNYTGSMLVPHMGVHLNDYLNTNEYEAVEVAISNGDIIAGEKLVRSNDFLVTDLLFSYDIHLSNETEIQFFMGVKNLFNQIQSDYDRGKYRDAAYVYGPSQPRMLNFGIKFGNL